jgi:hypothetical protein
MGRKPTGKTPRVGMRLTPEKRREIEEWAARQPDTPSFSEALRRLVDLGLLAGAKEE